MLKLVKVPFQRNSLLTSPSQSLLLTFDGENTCRKMAGIGCKPALES